MWQVWNAFVDVATCPVSFLEADGWCAQATHHVVYGRCVRQAPLETGSRRWPPKMDGGSRWHSRSIQDGGANKMWLSAKGSVGWLV